MAQEMKGVLNHQVSGLQLSKSTNSIHYIRQLRITQNILTLGKDIFKDAGLVSREGWRSLAGGYY